MRQGFQSLSDCRTLGLNEGRVDAGFILVSLLTLTLMSMFKLQESFYQLKFPQ
ncbi:hypothetical protein [Microcoleus sp. S28C3]|uniref:hypothetical protein n=1 Tax=Microcoleus sp. S28C3 TaxID=3055414 RepID=UPI002FCEC1D2